MTIKTIRGVKYKKYNLFFTAKGRLREVRALNTTGSRLIKFSDVEFIRDILHFEGKKYPTRDEMAQYIGYMNDGLQPSGTVLLGVWL